MTLGGRGSVPDLLLFFDPQSGSISEQLRRRWIGSGAGGLRSDSLFENNNVFSVILMNVSVSLPVFVQVGRRAVAAARHQLVCDATSRGLQRARETELLTPPGLQRRLRRAAGFSGWRAHAQTKGSGRPCANKLVRTNGPHKAPQWSGKEAARARATHAPGERRCRTTVSPLQ
jgi:hypothetical protein